MNVVSLRDRKKERTRDELEAVALQLFRDQGFDGTTVEQIAGAADVSPRTFFRYFATKEDVLFGEQIGADQQRSAALITDLRSRPADTPGALLCAALLDLSASYRDELDTLLIRKQVIAATPSLRSRALERRRSWESIVGDELRDRFPKRRSLLELRVTVATITAAMTSAVELWLETDGKADLTDLVRRSFDHLSTGLGIATS